MKRSLILCLSLAAIAALAPTVGAATTTAFTSKLTGSQETPAAGDPDGRANATVTFKGRTVCYTINLKNVAGSTAAHIQAGKKGVAGDVVVALFGAPSDSKQRKGCVKNIPATTLKSIKAKPSGFYLNVHNSAYPGGAVRGQLRKKSS